MSDETHLVFHTVPQNSRFDIAYNIVIVCFQY